MQTDNRLYSLIGHIYIYLYTYHTFTSIAFIDTHIHIMGKPKAHATSLNSVVNSNFTRILSYKNA